MRLAPRPVLTEEQLERMEQRVTHTRRTEEVFAAYRERAAIVRRAARLSDTRLYDIACRKLEHERERLDWILR